MRYIVRLPEPHILTNRKVLWLQNFLASGKKRPDSSKYAHNQVKVQLNSMSHDKCFYCETKLKGKRKEVDHHIEVTVDNTLSFEWLNLCLACDSCNNKVKHDTISINDALNPCIDSDNEIELHLSFDDELIEPNNGSPKGLLTIQKYRLDSEVLDTRRLKRLKLFYKLLVEIRDEQIRTGRDHLTANELSAINKFKYPYNSYSLMFKILLRKHGY